MSIVLVFLLAIAGIVIWWLSHQGLMAKPWLDGGLEESFAGAARPALPAPPDLPTAKIGLGVFLAVVGCLFALSASAYFMRMGLPDWQPLVLPRFLWLNTCALAVASVGLQSASIAAREERRDLVRLGLATGGLAGTTFLVGQTLAWRDLYAGGDVVTANPANSFFFLMTGLHGLHIVGGLVGLGRTMSGAWSAGARGGFGLSVELCAMYWHFLLVVWLAIFVLLNGRAAAFVDMCSQLLT